MIALKMLYLNFAKDHSMENKNFASQFICQSCGGININEFDDRCKSCAAKENFDLQIQSFLNDGGIEL